MVGFLKNVDSLFLAWTLWLGVLVMGCAERSATTHSSSIPAEAEMTPAVSSIAASTTPVAMTAAETQVFIEHMQPQVEQFCGDCHATPRPMSFDREDWPAEVKLGFDFYRMSGRSDLHPPALDDVTKYFICQAPEILEMPRSIVGNPDSRLRFEANRISKPAGKVANAQPPCISKLKWMDLQGDGSMSLVYCDLGTGSLYQFDPLNDQSPRLISVLYQPVSFEQSDLDRNGTLDLVVADLGEFDAADSELGRIVWLRGRPNHTGFDEIVLLEGLGRVSDVKAADFDNDGDVDLLVSEFGWRKTGRILMMEQTGFDENKVPHFELSVIDSRHGTIETPLVDLNQDSHLDFVALISQEHEVIEAFINDGTGKFNKETIYQANDPSYGSARIELADLDGDGDVDIAYANGDSFDSGSKPYHSVQWMENRGEYPFEHHHLTFMPGVLAIKVADFDHDGDLDIVAGALMAKPLDQSLEAAGVESLILLEQTAPGVFQRTQIETSAYQHGAIEVGDFDDDGNIDIAVGNFLHFQPHLSDRHDFTIWSNRGQK